jgi:hypothetical protein
MIFYFFWGFLCCWVCQFSLLLGCIMAFVTDFVYAVCVVGIADDKG